MYVGFPQRLAVLIMLDLVELLNFDFRLDQVFFYLERKKQTFRKMFKTAAIIWLLDLYVRNPMKVEFLLTSF